MSEIIEVITPDIIGKKVTCSINDIEITDAKIQYADNGYYICQNIVEGILLSDRCLDRLGYNYVWLAEKEGLRMYTGTGCVTNLKLVEDDYHLKRQKESERLRILQGGDWAEMYPINTTPPITTISNGTIGGWNIDNSNSISTHSKPKKEEEPTHLVETYTTPEYIYLNPIPTTYTWKRY